MRQPKSVQVKLNLKVFELSGTWEPTNAERRAAWELYVELITRVGVVPLGDDEGLLREALSSLYSIFSSTRDVLKRYGPEVASPRKAEHFNLALLASSVLNGSLRPLLAKWHPALEDWEEQRVSGVSRAEHERSWTNASELRSEIAAVGGQLRSFASILADAAGVENIVGDEIEVGDEA